MKALTVAPNLVDQVHEALVAEIAAGRLSAGDRVVQEQVARELGVSRQPVQQALLLLRKQGLLRDAPGRGLEVAPIDPQQVHHVYELRAAIEGLAARRAAEGAAERASRQAPVLIEAGRKAVASGSIARMTAADLRFHEFIYELSGNPLIASAMSTHWTFTQRLMGEVLTRDEHPVDIWDQHERIAQAIVAGDAERAEALAREHLMQASRYMVARLTARG
ncbi:MAG: GntR family transcriptional regulator [Ideonella sp.]|jgi:DNA-binding GntR family transcriptional regulator|nr:GntR family transcriptional regulator [Ideonella sp.]